MKKSLCALIGFCMLLALPTRGQESSHARKMAQKTLPQLMNDLRDDSIRFNAIHARDELKFHRGLEQIPYLEKALESDDCQQRQIAASLLRSIDEFNATERLIQETVAGLQNDKLPGRFDIFVFNATEGVRFFLQHPTVGTDELESALDSDDFQQRFLAAFILGATGRAEKILRIAEILIPHLKNDAIQLNACMATHALCQAGKNVTPFLAPIRDSEDAQQRAAARLILLDLESPPKTKGQFLARKQHHNLSLFRSDPAISLWKEPYFDIRIPYGIVEKSR